MTEQAFIPYTRQSINEHDIAAVTKALQDPFVTRGPTVKKFEEAVANYCGAKYAVAFNSGSNALQQAYHAVDLTTYDRVFTSANTFIATISAPLQQGAKVHFIDIHPHTGSMDLESLRTALESFSTRGRNIIVPMHYAGLPIDMDKCQQLIKDPNTLVIEDAAQAFGANYINGDKVGSCTFSDMTVFSFHPAKSICTGEGGLITTNQVDLYEKLLCLRNNGITVDAEEKALHPWKYNVETISGNFNFTDFQAALGLEQLKRLDLFVEKRRSLIKAYRRRLNRIRNLILTPHNYDKLSCHNLFFVKIDFPACHTTRSEVMTRLKQANIGTQVHFIPLYHHPYFKKNLIHVDSLNYPNTESFYSQALSLPLYYDLQESDVNYICTTLKQVLKNAPQKKSAIKHNR